MNEISSEIFQCPNCNVKYDTTKYKFKRPHKYLTQNTTVRSSNDGYENDDDTTFPF